MIPSRKNAKGQDEVKDALGVTYSVGRWICGDNVSPEQRVPLTESRVVAPDYKGAKPEKLPKAADEAKFVLSKIPGRQISPAMYDAFVADMQTGGAPVLHFVCHGAAQTPVAQQIYFENGQIISSVQLGGNKAFRAALQKKKPFIFLNACEVGRLQPALVGVGGFAQKFIERGASVVIAPLWSVKDDIAHDIALEFYETTEKYPDKPFAEILRDIRAKAYDSTTGAEDTYAAYCFYGDPLARRADRVKV
jgi:CHAT domain-containing protein